jgi:monofunctional glycosyltransferase
MKHAVRLLVLLLLGVLALQLYFAGRIVLMNVLAPQSTSFQRSEAWRLMLQKQQLPWRQQWVDGPALSTNLKRAVIASEDAGFADHGGVDWDALEKAWERNQKAEARAGRLALARPNAATRPAKVVGGSTITQQLAKNLFLSGERNLARKGQEFAVTLMLEALLSKQRILEIYLNNVEWGEGVFGAQAAARHYFRIDARQLSAAQAARLAVMLPAPKRFEKRPASAYVLARAGTIEARMGAVELP